jgi:hypothetical protein
MRLLVIVSCDFGELGSALYFLHGLPSKTRPVLLLPAALNQHEVTEGVCDEHAYNSLADIAGIIEKTAPDTVILFSGYLLNIGKRFSLINAWALLRLLRRRGCRVITSDPFLGLARRASSLQFDEVISSSWHYGRINAWLMARLLALRIYILYRQLRHLPHIYPAPIKPDRAREAGMSYFSAASCTAQLPLNDTGKPGSQPIWLYVMSRVDYAIQTQRLGNTFPLWLADRIREALCQGKRVAVVGPVELARVLRLQLAQSDDLELLSETSYRSYMNLIEQAEYAFFWNYFSFSIIHRVIRCQPVFYFDAGHMSSILPALNQIGIDSFYDGWKPPLLSMDKTLDIAQLAEAAADCEQHFEYLTARLSQGDSPSTLLQKLGIEQA